MVSYKARVFLVTFSCYVGIHSLRTTYSFSKGLIADTVKVDESELGIVDSLMLYALALGYLQQAIFPFAKPVFALGMGLLLTAVFYVLIPVALGAFTEQSFVLLCILMSIDGYWQSYSWPNLLMLVNSQYDNKKEAVILGVWMTNTNVGNILGFALCQLLVIRAGLHWQIAMYIIGLYVIFNALIVFCGIKQLPKVDAVPSGALMEDSKKEEIEEVKPFQNISNLLRSPIVLLMTATFSLVKSVQYGILLWLPLYFDLIGLASESAYIPITFDCASVVSSIALGYAFKHIQNKGLLLGPLIFILMLLFFLLRTVSANVGGYYVMIAGVGLCLGGTYNALASLVAMELVKVVDIRYRTKYLGFYSAVLMCAANLITATTQIILGYIIGKQEEKIFIIFFWYSSVALVLLIAIAILDRGKENEEKTNEAKQSYIEIVETH